MLHRRPSWTTADLRPHRGRNSALLAASLLALATLATPHAALARGGGDEVRVAGSCGRGATAELRLKADDGAIEVEYRVRRGRSGERWSIVVVHERRVAWRGRATTSGSSGSLRVRRTLPDFAGADEITARATNARGLTCTATGVLSAG